ncbi:MAG: hypothetical protein Q8R92_14410, partial [Deltaproteobacteria bacterium]|nr:hypothetical protein [Deltaproteobacteria bacterium]
VRASTTELEWPEVSTSETITHVSAWDAAEAGSPEWVAALAESAVLTAGDALRIKAASLTFTLT